MEIKIHRELYGKEPPVGYEAEIGFTGEEDTSPGRWIVRRDRYGWVLVFHSFWFPEYVICAFSDTEDGERAARTMALRLVDRAWGRN